MRIQFYDLNPAEQRFWRALALDHHNARCSCGANLVETAELDGDGDRLVAACTCGRRLTVD